MAAAIGLSKLETDSLQAAARMIAEEVQAAVGDSPTTVEQDEEELQAIKQCRERVGEHGDVEGLRDGKKCPSDIVEWGGALQMAVEFRLARKRLTRKVMKRLSEDCFEERGGDKKMPRTESPEDEEGERFEDEL